MYRLGPALVRRGRARRGGDVGPPRASAPDPVRASACRPRCRSRLARSVARRGAPDASPSPAPPTHAVVVSRWRAGCVSRCGATRRADDASPPATLRQVPKRSPTGPVVPCREALSMSAGNTPDGAPSAPSSWASSSGWPASSCTTLRTPPTLGEPPTPARPALPGIPNGPSLGCNPTGTTSETWVCGFNALSTTRPSR